MLKPKLNCVVCIAMNWSTQTMPIVLSTMVKMTYCKPSQEQPTLCCEERACVRLFTASSFTFMYSDCRFKKDRIQVKQRMTRDTLSLGLLLIIFKDNLKCAAINIVLSQYEDEKNSADTRGVKYSTFSKFRIFGNYLTNIRKLFE
jgi:hypothetical protein